MKPSTEILKQIGVRDSNDFERVFADFPIGHTVTVNGVSATVVGHQDAEIFGTHCLFIVIKQPNGDGMQIDPYMWNLEPKR